MNSTRSRAWWLGWKGLILLLELGLVGWGIKVKWFSKAPAPQVITADAELADMEDTVLASGTIVPVKQVSVGAQVSGQVKHLYVALGDKVKQGQLVAEIDATPQTNAMHNAESALLSIQAQRAAKAASLVQADLVLKRQQQLIKQDATSREDFEAAQAALNTLKAEIAAQDPTAEPGLHPHPGTHGWGGGCRRHRRGPHRECQSISPHHREGGQA